MSSRELFLTFGEWRLTWYVSRRIEFTLALCRFRFGTMWGRVNDDRILIFE